MKPGDRVRVMVDGQVHEGEVMHDSLGSMPLVHFDERVYGVMEHYVSLELIELIESEDKDG